jgi:hypothetical protein
MHGRRKDTTHESARMMSLIAAHPTTDADGLHNALAEIRAGRDDFHAQISDALANIERMGDDLLARAAQNEHAAVDQQTNRLASVIAELTGFLADQKRMVAEERAGWAKEMRHIRAQFASLTKAKSDSGQRPEAAEDRRSSGNRSPETSCP